MKILKKEPRKIRLCKGLTSLEFACQCNHEACKMTLVSKELIKAYEAFRILVNVRLKINSGYRCPQHNLEVIGKPMSRHQAGQAIDISLTTLDHLSKDDLEHAAKTSGFTFIKFYKSFIHMDVRS